MHSDPNEEHYEELIFDDDSASVADLRTLHFARFKSTPSSSKPKFDFGLSSSSLDPSNEQHNLEDFVQDTAEVETESTPKNVNVFSSPLKISSTKI